MIIDFRNLFIITSLYLFVIPSTFGQCLNATAYPGIMMQAPIIAGDTAVITDFQLAGDYYGLQNCILGETYTFETANPNDFITIRSYDNQQVVAFGNNPLEFTIVGANDFAIHINLQNPVCGTDGISRKSFVFIAEEPVAEIESNVGINTNDPLATLDINGKVKLGDDEQAPVAGTMRWNEDKKDFEGFNGSKWISFTATKGQWGIPLIEAVQESEKIIPLDTSFYKEFGHECKIFGDYIFVGDPRDSINGLYDVGSVYIFKKVDDRYEQQNKILPDVYEEGMTFGYNIAVSAEWMAVSAHSADHNGFEDAGLVYLYQLINDQWVFQEKINEQVLGSLNRFGSSIAMDNNNMIVGAPSARVNNLRTGKAYVYHFDQGWNLEAEIISSDGLHDASFGVSVDIHDTTIIVSDPNYPGNGTVDVGAAYIYTKENGVWGNEIKLVDLTGGNENFYGSKVLINETEAIVSSPGKINGFNYLRGAIFVYDKTSNWSNHQKLLVNGDSSESARIGYAMAVENDVLVVGNDKKIRGHKTNQGAAYVFQKGIEGWEKQVDLIASDGEATDYFGAGIAIQNNTILVGARFDRSVLAPRTGSVYIYNYCD